MGFVFDHETTQNLESWARTEAGRETLNLQKELILGLLKPRPGERLLDVGCGSGRHLQIFKQQGLFVTGLDPSPSMLTLARRRLGPAGELFNGWAENLPFEDNDFDVVTMITSLEFVDDPLCALSEAVRVARSRVLVCVLNGFSLTALGRRVKGMFRDTIDNRARYYSLWQLTGLIRAAGCPARLRWATTGGLPSQMRSGLLSSVFPSSMPRSPFGSFLVVVADVIYTMRTDNLVVNHGLGLSAKAAPSATLTGCGAIYVQVKVQTNHPARI